MLLVFISTQNNVYKNALNVLFLALLPVVMEYLEKKKWMQKIKPLHGPIQIMGVGCW